MSAELLPEVLDQGRLARADLAAQQDDADVALNPVFQVLQGVVVVGAQVQETGIGFNYLNSLAFQSR